MPKYLTKTALSVQVDPKNKPHKTKLVYAGTEIEMDDSEFTRSLVDRGGLVPTDEADREATDETSTVELPVRPSNGAPKTEWRTYLERLATVTDPEMTDPLVIPDNASRDDMIRIGDQRVAEWNEV